MLNPELTQRFKDCPWFKPLDIDVIGLGGVGRGVAETLFLQGHNIQVYDPDVVEIANCVPQGYTRDLIGYSKVDAFRYQMNKFSEDVSNIVHRSQKWEGQSLRPIVIAAADDWRTLHTLYNEWRYYGGQLFISPGMQADMFAIRVYMKDDGLDWVGGSDTETIPCTTKSSMYMAKMIHGRVTSIVNKFIINPELIDHEYRFDGILD